MKVYLAVKDVHYEGDEHLGVYASKEAALKKLAVEATKDKRSNFEPLKGGEEWESGAYGVTLKIEEFEVEE